MSTDGARSLIEVLADFEKMEMDVLYSPPGEFRMEAQEHFDKTNVPPEQLRCPDVDCDGTGVSLMEPLETCIAEKQNESVSSESVDQEIDFSRIYDCRGRKIRDGKKQERCFRLIKVPINGTLSQSAV